MNRHTSSRIRSLLPAVAFALLVSLTLAPSAIAAEKEFSISGRGWGHGIGMSQYGAKSLADHGYSYDYILRHYYRGTSLSSISKTFVRVAIQKDNQPKDYWTLRANDGSLAIDSDGNVATAEFTLAEDVAYTFVIDNSGVMKVRYQNSSGSIVYVPGAVFSGPVTVWERYPSGSTGVVQVLQNSGPFDWPNVIWRGTIQVIPYQVSASDWSMHIRNRVYMEDYLKGVVPRESPSSWPAESLKAQSVAARSYAYKSSGAGAYDLYCTTRSQVYNGMGQWTSGGVVSHEAASTNTAVAATKDRVAVYDGAVISTYFHSTSGGHTENNENVWGGTPLPYLRGVPDPYESSPKSTWEKGPWTASQLRSKLSAAGLPVPGQISGVQVLTRGVSGRVTSLRVLGAAGDHKTYTLSQVQKVRSALALDDTWFYVWGNTRRIAGDSRYDTAIEISKEAFPTGASYAVVVNGSAVADALSASALAGSLPGGAPVLLTDGASLPYDVGQEIARLRAGTVYVVGGKSVVSDYVAEQIRGVSGKPTVTRISGSTRYDTAAEVAKKVKALRGGAYDGRVLVVNGHKYADAVAAAPLAYKKTLPVLLLRSDSGVPGETTATLAAIGATRVLAVGGEGVVSEEALTSLGITYSRIAAGTDRYDTASKLAAYGVASEGFSWSSLYIASGQSLVDALAGGPLAGSRSASLLFTKRDSVPTPTANTLVARKTSITSCYLLGGTSAIGEGAAAAIEGALY